MGFLLPYAYKSQRECTGMDAYVNITLSIGTSTGSFKVDMFTMLYWLIRHFSTSPIHVRSGSLKRFLFLPQRAKKESDSYTKNRLSSIL